jgi:predicted dehydrogenase
MAAVRLMTLNPGHFHAALVQKEMYPQVSPRVDVYAPLGPDLLAHLGRIAGFNGRAQKPTSWQLEVHASSDWLARALAEKSGNVVVLAGFNRAKIDALLAAVEAGLNILADKPWIIHPADFPKLQRALDIADTRRLIAYDIMTERFEITSLLQRELVNDPAIFGSIVPGTADEPGVFMESKHYLMKTVAGVPLRRPSWYFDVAMQGEGLSDVGTHLVDLVPWMLFPGQPINHTADLALIAAKRWPTVLTKEDYQRVTGETDFAPAIKEAIRGDRLEYFCNTLVSYALHGIHIKLNVLWDYEAESGSLDTHFAVFRGTRSRVEVRQDREQNYRPELYVVPTEAKADVVAAVKQRVEALQAKYPGVGLTDLRSEVQITIPDVYRTGHEAHFGEVARVFFRYLNDPRALPSWEKPNMLAKYWVTTKGVQLAQGQGAKT